MARPTTKEDLIAASTQNFDKLMKLLDPLTEEEKNGKFHFDLEKEKGAHWKRDQNIRDVLIHLYEWQVLLLNWVKSNQKGVAKDFLPDGYNWRNYGEMNVELWKKHQSTPYDEALENLKDTHQKVMKLIDAFSNEELFSKGAFPWTGNNTLGAYVVSSTSSHYDWALKKIRKYLKGLN
ncbi:ClbS/DfsB family four-helix bundle protein [Xylocopilactobacillus apicola]|uniref:ClbS/DfsB family four-helix bundle protein n=1 Tax=Xylocopilactobacillus apicola TaxID=2932184 RepID=A0AAU9CUZ8_9LACO|nr:ClbS/DfsB family four-helix bundle protein [Xylocopilactobacillus apicola]BDR57824.1 hypothetical protein XA3_02650 [Xylocopilactobacillus apicola]